MVRSPSILVLEKNIYPFDIGVFSAETFWLDLVLRNPLDVDVTLSGLTAVVEDAAGQAGPSDLVEVEAIDDITLNAKETRTVCGSLNISVDNN